MSSSSGSHDLVANSGLPPVPARTLLRDIPPIEADDSPRQAIRCFRRHQVSELPVTCGGALVGWLGEEQAAEAALDDAGAVTVRALMAPVPALISPEARGDELLAFFQATGNSLLPVIAFDGRYLGCVTRVDALAAREGWFPPPRIGGMATPLGVYLTTGTVNGGAGNLGLILTGMVFAVMMWGTQNVLLFAAQQLARLVRWPFLIDLAKVLGRESIKGTGPYVLSLVILSTLLLFAAFLLLLRYLPLLAGYHAAEHQTVNAIEAGEALTPESVARMSRVHPRCGTNLWSIVALSYLGVTAIILLLTTEVAGYDIELIVTLAVFGILFVTATWKRIGGWLQEHLTTRPTAPKELASGIAAGMELLRRHLETAQSPRRGLRVWRMGFIQVLIGVMIMGSLLQLLDVLWHNLVK